MLESVFDKGRKGGTARSIDVRGFKAGGKSSTTHKFDPESRRYSDHKYLSSFGGLAPIDKPRIAVLVVIDEPEIGKWGGKTAAPVFGNVAKRVLPHLGILPGGAQLIRTASLAHNAPPQQALVQ